MHWNNIEKCFTFVEYLFTRSHTHLRYFLFYNIRASSQLVSCFIHEKCAHKNVSYFNTSFQLSPPIHLFCTIIFVYLRQSVPFDGWQTYLWTKQLDRMTLTRVQMHRFPCNCWYFDCVIYVFAFTLPFISTFARLILIVLDGFHITFNSWVNHVRKKM